ncbi:DMT family transporter [Thermogladius sp. 4427co]|uniref:DMT family transporter n=1 Tax=Thermogladius sp. 4427co TaxID=3450718 RepID=UPI003F796531
MGKLETAIYILIISLSISVASILVLLSGLNAGSSAFWRLSLSSLILYLVSRKRIGFRDRKILLASLLSGLFLGFHFILWMESLFLIPVFESTLLVDTYPLILVFLERLIFKTRIEPKSLVAISAALLLLYIFLGDGSIKLSTGDAYAIISSFMVALYFLLGRYIRYNLKSDVFNYVIPTYASASITSLIYTLSKGGLQTPVNLFSLMVVVSMAVVPMIGGHTLMNYLIGKYRSHKVASIVLSEPIGAGVLAYLVFGQSISIIKILTGLGVLACILIVWM